MVEVSGHLEVPRFVRVARSAARPRLTFARVASADAGRLIPKWRALAERSVGDNCFFDPDFALPAMRHLGADVAIATVSDPAGSPVALAPFTRARLGRIAPAARLGEYVQAVRAILHCWEAGERLDYRGKYYSFTLMTPEFSPGRLNLPMVPVAMAAVGPLMLKTAARVADSVRLHSFATREYLQQVVRPMLAAELTAAGKSFEHFEITGGGFVATGPDPEAVRVAAEKVRYRVAFYGSTPAYRGVFDVHGLGALGAKLTEMSKQGAWTQMAAQIPDEVLDLFVARAPYDGIAQAIERRFGGLVDTVSIDFTPGTGAATRRDVIAAIQRVPHAFKGFRT